jgi:leucyl-tRNA synthetase
MRFTIELDLSLNIKEIEDYVLNDDRTINQLDGSVTKKIIIIPGKIVNIVY